MQLGNEQVEISIVKLKNIRNNMAVFLEESQEELDK